MTIPEPSNEALAFNLHDLYAHVYNGVQLTQMSVRELISRAYHAERERDALRQWKETQSKFHTELLNQHEKLEKETDALRTKLHDSDRIGTHYDGCWDSGPRHYACAIAEIAKLRARVAELEAKGVAGE